ncbi:MAG: mechanosensitive ion channel family protein [Ignavibacteriae bacterium]|nr:MAG: mechanosensitive ion channel family protein [Ignavibacteriota bacterium]
MGDLYQRLQQWIGTGFSLYLWNGAVAFAAVMIIGFFFKYFLNTIGRRLVAKTQTDLDDKLFAVILPRVKWLAIVIGFYLAVEQVAKGIAHTDKSGEELIRYSEGILYLLFVSLVTILVIRIIDTLLKHSMEMHARKTSSTVDEAIFPILTRMVMMLIFFIAIVITLGHFGVDVSSLLVFLGGGSVALALAAQDTLSNMIAGFVIMLDRPFRLGDRIKLPSGEIGDVYEIGLRSTKILDFDNNLIVSPNADLTKTKVINYSYPKNEIRVLVEVSIAYGTSIERARELMLNFARQNPELLKQPEPSVFFSSMGESSCVLQLIGRTDDWKKKARAENILREQIYTAFMKEGISSGIAQHVVQLTSPIPHGSPKND